MHRVATDVASLISVGGLAMKNEQVSQVAINGAVRVRSIFSVGKSNIGSGRGTTPTPTIEMERVIFPTVDKAAMCEIYTLKNISDRARVVYVPDFKQVYTTLPEKGVTGSYLVELSLSGEGTYTLAPQQELTVVATLQAYRQGEQPVVLDAEAELKARMAFVEGDIDGALVLDTPDDVIDRAFRMAKLRASESICKTAGGYMHAPGGESYYAALWANDQAEYRVGPELVPPLCTLYERRVEAHPQQHYCRGYRHLEWRRRQGRRCNDCLWRIAFCAGQWRQGCGSGAVATD